MPRALELFPNGRGDEDEVLPLGSADDPLPQSLAEEGPGPAAAPPTGTIGRRCKAVDLMDKASRCPHPHNHCIEDA